MKIRQAAGTIAAAAAIIGGAAGGAHAGSYTDTCTHTTKYPSSGHQGVRYNSSYTNSGGGHMHRYTHDVANWFDHTAERGC